MRLLLETDLKSPPGGLHNHQKTESFRVSGHNFVNRARPVQTADQKDSECKASGGIPRTPRRGRASAKAARMRPLILGSGLGVQGLGVKVSDVGFRGWS